MEHLLIVTYKKGVLLYLIHPVFNLPMFLQYDRV